MSDLTDIRALMAEADELRAQLATEREALKEIAENPVLLEIGRRAIEDALIDMRDSRISMFGRGNGLVIREKDGTESSVIRLGTEDALRIGLRAIARAALADAGELAGEVSHAHH